MSAWDDANLAEVLDDNATLRTEIDRLKEREATLRRVLREKQAQINGMWRKEDVRTAFGAWLRDVAIAQMCGEHIDQNAAFHELKEEIERTETGV